MTADRNGNPSTNEIVIESNRQCKKIQIKASMKSQANESRFSNNQLLNTLLIPTHFNNIFNIFISLDTVVNKLIKKRNSLYFDRISESLSEMNINDFDFKAFGKILRIFPESYSYEFDKPPLKMTRHYREKMKIIPNLNFGNNFDSSVPANKKSVKLISLQQLISRKQYFYDRLLEQVQEKHNVFLMKFKNLSKEEIENFSIDRKWHEDFNLEVDVDEIEPIQLNKNQLKTLPRKSLDTVAKFPITRISNGNSSNIVSNTNKMLQTKSSIVNNKIINERKEIVPTKSPLSVEIKKKLSSVSGKENKKSIKSSKIIKETRLPKSPLPISNHSSTDIVNKERVLNLSAIKRKETLFPTRSPLSVSNCSSVEIKNITPQTNFSPSFYGKENEKPNKSSKILKETSLPKSPLSVSNRSSDGIKNKTPMTNLSANNGRENKYSNNQNPPLENIKETLIPSNVNNSSVLHRNNRDDITDKLIQRKSSDLKVRFSTEAVGKLSSGDHKLSQSVNRIPLRKSAVTPIQKSTPSPRRPNNQPRLSFVSNSNNNNSTVMLTPKGNFLNSLTVPNSPMLKKPEFLLKQKLPVHLKVLYESFMQLEKLIYNNRKKSEPTYLMSAVELLWNHKFSESQLGRIMAVYPDAYSIKLQQIPSKNGLRSTSKIDIAIRPNLESSSFLKFDFTSMKNRAQKFMENCVEIVVLSYREFLNKNSINLENLEDHIKNEDWNSNFNIDLDVKTIEPVPMPQKSKPKELENTKLNFSTIKKAQNELTNCKVSPLKNNEKLGSLSQSLIDKVRMNKAKNSIVSRQPATVEKDFMASKLPEIATIIANEFKMFHNKPLERSQILKVVCKSLQINESYFNQYLNMLNEIVPGWIQHLNWAVPRLAIGMHNLSFDQVLDRLKKNVISEL